MVRVVVMGKDEEKGAIFTHTAKSALAVVEDGVLLIRTVEESLAEHEYTWPESMWGTYRIKAIDD